VQHRHIGGAFILALVLLLAAAWALTPDFGAIRGLEVMRAQLPAADGSVLKFKPSQQPARPVLYLPAHTSPLQVLVNGTPLPESSRKRLEGLSRRHSASVFTMPAGGAVQQIEIQSLTPAGAHQISPVYYGPEGQIRPVADQQNASIAFSRTTLLAIIGMSIAIAFLLIFFSRNPMRYVFLLATFVVLALLNFERSLSIFGVPMRDFSEYTLQFYVVFSFLTIAYWTDLERKLMRRLLIVYAIIFVLILLLDVTKLPNPDLSDAIKNMLFYCSGIFTAVFNFVQIIRSYYSKRPEYQLISTAFALGTVGIIVSILAVYFANGGPLSFTAIGFSNLTGAASMMMLTIVALYFEFAHYRSSVLQNRAFSSLVAGHNAELDRHATALKSEIERRAILEERQRFTRDMHDGIGGQLLSLLMKARRGDVSPAELESDIAKSINDLRLVAASLDGSDEGLIVSFHSLRERLRDQLDAAGISFGWIESDNLELAELGPRATLNILRIMQEGVTNVVRHAQATRVEINVAFDPIRGALALTLADNGKGIGDAEQTHAGKGLRNMRTRADQVGGILNISSAPDDAAGTLVTLTVPCDGATTPQPD
jgi:signal transduction histidine kinase